MGTGEVNFTVVERSSTEIFELYDKIKQDVIDGLKIKDICEKYKITDSRWLKFRKQLIKDGLIESSSKSRKNGKFYYYNKQAKKYFVVKSINKKKIWFGAYKREEDAKSVVEKLKECDWDKSQMPKILEELGI